MSKERTTDAMHVVKLQCEGLSALLSNIEIDGVNFPCSELTYTAKAGELHEVTVTFDAAVEIIAGFKRDD